MTITIWGNRVSNNKEKPGISLFHELLGAKSLGVAEKSGNHALAPALFSGARLSGIAKKRGADIVKALKEPDFTNPAEGISTDANIGNHDSSVFNQASYPSSSRSQDFMLTRFYFCKHDSLYPQCSADDRISLIGGT